MKKDDKIIMCTIFYLAGVFTGFALMVLTS